MPNPHAPYYPIIYVRGYAMTEREQDETTADPFCGFNLGSTVFRATPEKDKPARKFIFESPKTSDGRRGIISRTVRLVKHDGTVAQEGVAELLVELEGGGSAQ